jgi:hypothetical protein
MDILLFAYKTTMFYAAGFTKITRFDFNTSAPGSQAKAKNGDTPEFGICPVPIKLLTSSYFAITIMTA